MIAVLGGGVAGLALARELALRGRRDVVVFDPQPMGSGSTGRAFGGFRTQQGSALNIALSLAARPFFEARAERIDFHATGYLYLAEDAAAAAELAARAELQRACGLPVEHPEPAALVPFVDAAGVLATNYCALDGVYRPPLILDLLAEEARAAGADLRYGAEAGPGDLEDVVVVAAGIWSRTCGERLGVSLDVTPLERGVFVVGPFDWLPGPTPVTLDVPSGYHFRERDHRLLLIGPGDPRDWSHHRDWLARRVPRAAVEKPESWWSGFYEMTPDHHPLVGETERPGVWADCGFSGHGVMHAPAVAESLAAMLLGETPRVDITPLNPRRGAALVDATQL